MHRKLLSAVAVCAAVLALGAGSSSAVVGGSNAAPGEFPSVAQVAFGVGLQFRCTGTLIDSTHVLTAGHCGSVTGAAVGSPAAWPPQAISVWIGGHEDRKGERVPVSQVTVSPSYLGLSSKNDIAILTLATASTKAPTKVAGAAERSIWNPGVLATIAGWGVTEEDGDTPKILQKAQVPITTDDYCRQAYGSSSQFGGFDPQTMVCAGYPEGGVDTCQGDSGGPLFADAAGGVRRVVGVTSWGEGCARAGKPGVYARVADTKLREWVRTVAPDGVN